MARKNVIFFVPLSTGLSIIIDAAIPFVNKMTFLVFGLSSLPLWVFVYLYKKLSICMYVAVFTWWDKNWILNLVVIRYILNFYVKLVVLLLEVLLIWQTAICRWYSNCIFINWYILFLNLKGRFYFRVSSEIFLLTTNSKTQCFAVTLFEHCVPIIYGCVFLILEHGLREDEQMYGYSSDVLNVTVAFPFTHFSVKTN